MHFSFFKNNPSLAALSVYMAESRRLSKLLRISRRQYESKLSDDGKSNPFNPRLRVTHIPISRKRPFPRNTRGPAQKVSRLRPHTNLIEGSVVMAGEEV